jgi:glutamate dehydrogenase (NAD(P)+)
LPTTVEYSGGDQELAFQTIAEKIRTNTQLILEKSMKTGALPRQSAIDLARQRVIAEGRRSKAGGRRKYC